MRVLVAGVGNILRGDDGFGVEVVRRLRARREGAPGVELREYGIAGIPFAQDLFSGFDGVVVVDAARMGQPPGTVRVLAPRDSDGAGLPLDLHQADPARAIGLAASFGVLPTRIRIVACEPLETEELKDELSPPVAAAAEEAIGAVLRILGGWAEELREGVAAPAREGGTE